MALYLFATGKRVAGFSLAELLLAVLITSLLATVGLTVMRNPLEKFIISECQQHVGSLLKAAQIYHLKTESMQLAFRKSNKRFTSLHAKSSPRNFVEKMHLSKLQVRCLIIKVTLMLIGTLQMGIAWCNIAVGMVHWLNFGQDLLLIHRLKALRLVDAGTLRQVFLK